MQRAAARAGVAGTRAMDFHLVPIMGLQRGAITVETDVLTALRQNPASAGLLQATAQHCLLAIGGAAGTGGCILIVWSAWGCLSARGC